MNDHYGSFDWGGVPVALTTRHGKERLIGPALATIGLHVEVANVDTDQFGTFTGEVKRRGSAHDVVVAKARAGMELTGLVRGVASEGTFGPIPELPVVQFDQEYVAFIDLEYDLTVVEEAIGFETVVASHRLGLQEDPQQFLGRIGFPEQGVIVRRGDGVLEQLVKGVTSTGQLQEAIGLLGAQSSDRHVILETDMRAHLCPSRQVVIAQAAERLAVRLGRRCPKCGCPGFGVIEQEPGLPCGSCGAPTTQDRAVVEACSRCHFVQRVPSARREAAPEYCEFCNP